MEGPTDFMNSITFSLLIESTHPNVTLTPTSFSVVELPESKIVNISADNILVHDDCSADSVSDSDEDELCHEPSNEELAQPGFVGSEMTLCSPNTEMTFHSPTGIFSAREVIDNIVEFERNSRPNTNWLGGFDSTHVFFEGLSYAENGKWDVLWGS